MCVCVWRHVEAYHTIKSGYVARFDECHDDEKRIGNKAQEVPRILRMIGNISLKLAQICTCQAKQTSSLILYTDVSPAGFCHEILEHEWVHTV